MERGAYGSVCRATDNKLGRPVALKLLKDDGGDEDRMARFWREADLVRRLTHPHTVRVYDSGQDANGNAYIVFELLQGESLKARLERVGPLSFAETRRITTCLLKSLMEAHGLGIVHRDVKPSNVFLCEYVGETDYVKLLDFGVARQADLAMTQKGWLVGTPAYMAPEQIAGKKLTPRVDLYSLGLVMVEMLSGRQLLSGKGPDVIAEQMAPHPLVLPPEVMASPLGLVVQRAVEKDPDRRYGSAAEMLADLERAPVAAPPGPATQQAWTQTGPGPAANKTPVLLLAIVAAAILGVSVLVIGAWVFLRGDEEPESDTKAAESASARPRSTSTAEPTPGVVVDTAPALPDAGAASRSETKAAKQPPAGARETPPATTGTAGKTKSKSDDFGY
jgi:serine/threonine-protein kinase